MHETYFYHFDLIFQDAVEGVTDETEEDIDLRSVLKVFVHMCSRICWSQVQGWKCINRKRIYTAG